MWNLWEVLRQLEMRVANLEAANADLRHQLKTLKRPMRVKKIVYNVHSLHIQEMKGTMNLGITAPLPEEDMVQMELEMMDQQD